MSILEPKTKPNPIPKTRMVLRLPISIIFNGFTINDSLHNFSAKFLIDSIFFLLAII